MEDLSRSSPRINRLVALVLVCMAVFQFAVQVGSLTRGVEYVATTLTVDDAYYYLQTAWNTKQLGFTTFDGIHPTNGVQLLWFGVVLLIAVFMPTKTALLFAVLVTCFLFNALCYLIIWRLGRLVRRPTLTLYMACLWLLLSFGSGVYSMGMENSLHALVFWGVVWRTTVFLLRVQHGERPNLLGLTVVLILNAWARVDAALFSVLLYVYCLVKALKARSYALSRRKDVLAIVGTALLAACGAAVQLITFRLMGGSYLPISVLVKGSWAAWEAEKLLALVPLAAGMILLLLESWLINRHSQGQKESTALHSVWHCLLVGLLVHMIATAGVEAYRHYLWYLSPVYIFWIIAGSTAVDDVLEVTVKRRTTTLRWSAAVGLVLVIISGIMFSLRFRIKEPLYVARYRVARWMAANLPPDAVCASWNAGQIGFFSERTVINLDGLINGVDYYDRVIRGGVSRLDYIYENDVSYLVDHKLERRLPQKFLPLLEVPINDGSGETVQVWQVSVPGSLNGNE